MRRPPADRLESRFLEELVRGCHVVAGFSGGADSVSLLHYLWQNRQRLELTVEAVHLNHTLRGEESDRDEDFVRSFCRERAIPLTLRRTDIAGLARERGMSLEACGREERYRLFDEASETARQHLPGSRVRIATAHTLSDDLETVLFRMARGTGLDGLCGIPRQRGAIVRPLLCCTREMVEEYCRRCCLSFVEDSTNRDPRYARNRIRLETVPALRQINSGAEEAFLRQRQELEADRDYLEQQTDALLQAARREKGLAAALLAEAHDALLWRSCGRILRQEGLPVDRKSILALAELIREGQGRLELQPECPFVVRQGLLRLERTAEVVFPAVSVPAAPLADGMRREVAIEQMIWLDNLPRQQEKKLWLQVITAKDWMNLQKVYENLLFFAVDYDTIIDSLNFRPRQAGDTLAQPSRGGRTLKKLFSEKGLTALERQTRLVAADAGSVFWAEGFEADRRVQIRPEQTVRVLLAFRKLPSQITGPQLNGSERPGM